MSEFAWNTDKITFLQKELTLQFRENKTTTICEMSYTYIRRNGKAVSIIEHTIATKRMTKTSKISKNMVSFGIYCYEPQGCNGSSDGHKTEETNVNPMPELLYGSEFVPLRHQVHVIREDKRQRECADGSCQAHEISKERQESCHQRVNDKVSASYRDSE